MATTVKPQRGLTFDDVWAALMETRERQERDAREFQELREALKETDRLMKENERRWEKQKDDFNKRFGEFTNRFGEVVEYMIAPNLLLKFEEYGLFFHEAFPDAAIRDGNRKILFEVDVLLQNSDKAMLVEIKTKLTTRDVKGHMKRLGKMRANADSKGDKRVFLGAVAGVVMTANVKEYALGQGMYVIEPSGETFNITPPNGKPKEW